MTIIPQIKRSLVWMRGLLLQTSLLAWEGYDSILPPSVYGIISFCSWILIKVLISSSSFCFLRLMISLASKLEFIWTRLGSWLCWNLRFHMGFWLPRVFWCYISTTNNVPWIMSCFVTIREVFNPEVGIVFWLEI